MTAAVYQGDGAEEVRLQLLSFVAVDFIFYLRSNGGRRFHGIQSFGQEIAVLCLVKLIDPVSAIRIFSNSTV
jgi:hypothetical protein